MYDLESHPWKKYRIGLSRKCQFGTCFVRSFGNRLRRLSWTGGQANGQTRQLYYIV